MTSDAPRPPACLFLPPPLRAAMLDHAAACLPEEGCGLLGGRVQPPAPGEAAVLHADQWLPVENALHSPTRFRMEPAAQWAAFQAVEGAGLELVALFHSHPRGPRHPSPTDLAEFAYPGVLTLIAAPGPGGWELRAFHIPGPGGPALEVAIRLPTGNCFPG